MTEDEFNQGMTRLRRMAPGELLSFAYEAERYLNADLRTLEGYRLEVEKCIETNYAAATELSAALEALEAESTLSQEEELER